MLDPIEHDLLVEPRLFVKAVDDACGEDGSLPAGSGYIGHPCSKNATINNYVRNTICSATI
jgi:hypothetical protein